MALLEVNNLGISFGGLRAVDELNLSIERVSSTVSSVLTVLERPQFSICSQEFTSLLMARFSLMAMILQAKRLLTSISQVSQEPSRTSDFLVTSKF